MLEEYKKSLIANAAYMKRIMQIINNIKSSKLISTIDGKCLVQVSDGQEALNIFNKGNCYSINLNGTNFSSILGNYDNYYLYKNDKLDIEYKVTELILQQTAAKRTIQTKAKEYESFFSYIDDNSELLPIISLEKIEGEPTYFIYDKNLVNLNNDELSQFVTARREKQNEKQNEGQDATQKLPRNIEEFDYSSYEEYYDAEEDLNMEEYYVEQDFEEIEDNYDDLDESKKFQGNESIEAKNIAEQQLENINEYYKNLVVTVDEEEIDGLEKIQFLQSLDIELSEEDETIFDITESIDRIIATYEAERARLAPQKESFNAEK